MYVLYCLTTAIVAGIQIYSKVHARLKDSHKEDNVVRAPWTAHFIFGLICFITAPIMIVVLLVPKSMDQFIDSMYESLTT